MVHTAFATVFLYKRGNSALGARGLQKLDFHVAAAKKCGFDLLVGNLFNGIALQTHHVLPVADGLLEVGHGYTDVFNMGRCHFGMYLVVIIFYLSTDCI